MESRGFEPADIEICIKGKGTVLKEKSLVALDTERKEIVAFGSDAEQMEKEHRENITILSPLRQGMIADYTVAEKLFSHLLKKALRRKPLRRHPICIFVSRRTITEVEKMAIGDALYQSGASELLMCNRYQAQFIKEMPEEFLKVYAKYKTVIHITKDNPESYITEAFAQILQYAKNEGISLENITMLLQKALPEKLVEKENIINEIKTEDWCTIPSEPADIVIYVKEKGMVLKEKSLVAYDTQNGKIVAFGTEAEQLLGDLPENIAVVSPLRQGVIADYSIAVKLFTYLIKKVFTKRLFRKPCVVICIHKSITEVEKKAVFDVLYQAGAGKPVLSEMPAKQLLGEAEFEIMIDITKDDPTRYIAEEIDQIIEYAVQENISVEKVMELWKETLMKSAGISEKG